MLEDTTLFNLAMNFPTDGIELSTSWDSAASQLCGWREIGQNIDMFLLKIITAAASVRSSEIKIRRHLCQCNPDHPGYSFVVSFLDDFSIDGPNGRHQCIVSEVVGASIIEAREATTHEVLPLDVARRIIAQLALGLAYTHSCGILHGGQCISLFETNQ